MSTPAIASISRDPFIGKAENLVDLIRRNSRPYFTVFASPCKDCSAFALPLRSSPLVLFSFYFFFEFLASLVLLRRQHPARLDQRSRRPGHRHFLRHHLLYPRASRPSSQCGPSISGFLLGFRSFHRQLRRNAFHRSSHHLEARLLALRAGESDHSSSLRRHCNRARYRCSRNPRFHSNRPRICRPC